MTSFIWFIWNFHDYTQCTCLGVWYARISVVLNSDFIVRAFSNWKSNHQHMPIHLLQSIDAHLHREYYMFIIIIIITELYHLCAVPCKEHLNGFDEWMNEPHTSSTTAIKSTFVHLQMEKVGIQVQWNGIIISWYI